MSAPISNEATGKACPKCGKKIIFPDTHYCAFCNTKVYYGQLPSNIAVEEARTVLNLIKGESYDRALEKVASAITKACAERDAKLEKVKRVAEIAEKWNDEHSEMDAALSCSLNEALAHDVLEQTEKERDSLSAQLAVMKEALEYIKFQSEQWSSTGDNQSLREAMQSFAKLTAKWLSNLPAAAVKRAHGAENLLDDLCAKLKCPQDAEALLAAVEELLKDRERLDWLEKTVSVKAMRALIDSGSVVSDTTALRSAIDAVRKT